MNSLKAAFKDKRIVFLLIFAGISVIVSSFLLFHNGINGVDAFYYWVNSAYSVRGYNLEWVKESGFVLDSIGKMQGIGVLPYGRVLNNFLFPGFLPYNVAYIYNFILIAFITVLLGINIYKWILENGFFDSKQECIIASICFIIIPWLWPGYLRAGNIGGLIALMGILAAFYVDRNDGVAAVLLAFALIKPQIGGVFFILLIFTKKYRLLFKTTGVIIVSEMIHMVYISIMNHVRGIYWPLSLNSVISIFEGYAGKNADKERGETWYLYYGIFNLLKEAGVPVLVVLIMSMLAGVAFIYFVLKYIKKCEKLYSNNVLLFSVAALASLFWFYKSECDNIVVLLCNLIILFYLKDSQCKKKKEVIISGIFIIGVNWLIGRYLLRFPMQIVSYPVGILIDQVIQIIVYVMMISLIVRKESAD